MSETFRDYQLLRQIARKKSSSLYLAQHAQQSSVRMVIKVFDTISLDHEQAREAFLHELAFYKQLRHPHVLPLIEGDIEHGHPYIVQPYIAFGSLYSRVTHQPMKNLPYEQALQLLEQIGEGLAHAHAWGILHANLKPENVLLTEDVSPLLTDFHLANTIDTTLPGYRPDSRTACYMAPERFSGKASKESDQYALGCIAYELLTGVPPFTAASLTTWRSRHTSEMPAPLTAHVPDLPVSVNNAVLRTLAKDPAERYPTLLDFLEVIHNAIIPVPSSANAATEVVVETAHQPVLQDLPEQEENQAGETIFSPQSVPVTSIPEDIFAFNQDAQETEIPGISSSTAATPLFFQNSIEQEARKNRTSVLPVSVLRRPTRAVWLLVSLLCLFIGSAVAIPRLFSSQQIPVQASGKRPVSASSTRTQVAQVPEATATAAPTATSTPTPTNSIESQAQEEAPAEQPAPAPAVPPVYNPPPVQAGPRPTQPPAPAPTRAPQPPPPAPAPTRAPQPPPPAPAPTQAPPPPAPTPVSTPTPVVTPPPPTATSVPTSTPTPKPTPSATATP